MCRKLVVAASRGDGDKLVLVILLKKKELLRSEL